MNNPKELLIYATNLLPGDILLFRSIDQKRHQRKISAVTGSPYTHAAIYLGNGEIAESIYPKVQIRKFSGADNDNQVIGVLRSQLGFSKKRIAALRSFVDRLIAQDARYDWRGAIAFQKRRSVYIDELLNNLEKNYGRIATKNEFAKKSYFCSALVVACYTLSGIIGDNAQIVYRPDVFSPGDLHADPTFGWFLGYITQKGPNIPLSDPLLTLTLWKDNEEMRCW